MNSPTSLASRREGQHNRIIYYFHVVVTYIIVIACLLNLSLSNDKDCTWTSFLSACIVYLLPPPKLRK